MRNFMMCAMLAGLAGILENVRAITLNPDPSATSNYLFLSISAAVIGGTLLQGGSGTVVGAFIGALFLGILTDGLTLIGHQRRPSSISTSDWPSSSPWSSTPTCSRVRTGAGRG